MAKIKGITVTLITRQETGKDPFDNPIYTDVEIPVKNVLVSPTSSDDVVNTLSPHDPSQFEQWFVLSWFVTD